jgi:hypothetical protein
MTASASHIETRHPAPNARPAQQRCCSRPHDAMEQVEPALSLKTAADRIPGV